LPGFLAAGCWLPANAARSVFKDDVNQEAIKVSESLILELSPVGESGTGVCGLLATSITTYMDPALVQAKAKEVMAGR
jgi:hypothetical protein